MPEICDRSPCDGLLGALGSYISGSKETFVLSYKDQSGHGTDALIKIKYCPFCGTRLEIMASAQD